MGHPAFPSDDVDDDSLVIDELKKEIEHLKENTIQQTWVIQAQREEIDKLKSPEEADGMTGWLMVLCAFTLQFTVLGAINSYSVFIKNLKHDDDLGKPNNWQVSLIYSIANGLTPVVGLIAGKCCDKYGPRPVLSTAAVSLGAGFFVSSYCHSYVELIFSFGIFLGISAGCTIAPGLSVVGQWFDKKRSLAFGLVYAGSGAGTTAVPLLANYLVERDGNDAWRGPFRIIALLSIPALMAALLMKRRLPYVCPLEDPESHLKLKQIITSRTVITLFVVGLLFTYGFFSLVIYIPQFAEAMGTDKPYLDRHPVSDSAATWLLSIFGISQTVGNIVWGDFSRRWGNIRMFKWAHFVCGAMMIAWPFCATYITQAVFAGAVGFFVAGCITCYPAVAADHFAGPQLGSILSIIYLGFGSGSLIGPPLTGAIIDMQGGSYLIASIVCSVGFILAMVLVHLFIPKSATVMTRMPNLLSDPTSTIGDYESSVGALDRAISEAGGATESSSLIPKD